MRKLLLATAASLSTLLGAGTALAQPAKPVAPGTISVYLKGYLQFEIADYGAPGIDGPGTKLNSVATQGDVRLYPGFDAATTNGIGYGAHVETRVANLSSGAGSSVYVRRAYGYIGTPDYGYVRFGQTDSVYDLMQYGVIEGFGDGNLWAAYGGPVDIFPKGKPGQFIYADQGALYETDKIVYFTPSFEGLSGGVGFEPNNTGIKTAVAPISEPGGSASLRRNTVDVMAQYVTKAGGLKTKASVGYLYGSPVGNLTGPQKYDALSVFQIGAQTTFEGLTVGANLKTGAVQDGYKLKPEGGRDGFSYTVGAKYAVGPYVLGASYFNGQTAGKWTQGGTTARTLSEYGIAVGANYALAKPINLWVEYLYGHTHQPTATSDGNGQVQLISLGSTLKW